MENENLFTSLPQPDSCISLDNPPANGQEEAITLVETVVQINQPCAAEELALCPKAGRESPEEAHQWEPEQIICSIPYASTCISVATVQWDMPDPSAEMPPLVTDCFSANELDCEDVRCVTDVASTSPSLDQFQDFNAELIEQPHRERLNRVDSPTLNLDVKPTGNECQPCDVTDVHESNRWENRNSTHKPLDSSNETLPRTDSEEEERHSVTSDPGETEDLINTAEEIVGSDGEVDSLLHLKAEEEQEEPSAVLSGQRDSEGEPNSENGVETEEATEEKGEVEVEGEEEEEQRVVNLSCSEESDDTQRVSHLTDVEEPTAQLHEDEDPELTLNPNKLTDLSHPELLEERVESGAEEDTGILEQMHEDLTSLTEGVEMCKDIDQNIGPEQVETMDNTEEASVQEVENVDRLESSQESQEVVGNLEDISCLEQDCEQTTSDTHDKEVPLQTENSESNKEPEVTEELEQIPADQTEEQHLDSDQLGQSPEMAQADQSAQREGSPHLELTVCTGSEDLRAAEQQEQTDPSEQNEQLLKTTVSTSEVELNQVDKQAQELDRAEDVEGTEDANAQTVVANGEQPKPLETTMTHMNGEGVDREAARRLAEQLFNLEGIQRPDVVKHLDKDDFSRAVGEEYLKFFNFTGETLDHALRSFLKVVVLIGESQERERVLQHFSCRFHQCNPDSFSSSGAVLALTCALMLLNTDLHGHHVGKSMSSSKFVSNLDGMNEEGNFSKDLLKSLYNSIKSEPLEWAINEEELKTSVLPEVDTSEDRALRSKANPFLDVPHDKNATVVKEGFLQRKLHADIDGKRTPWGKRRWKVFHGVLRGMVLYLQKNDYPRDQPINEEVVLVHHSLAEQATDYTKKPHVFRLQTADWRVFLFQTASKGEMNSWISRINLVSALQSSPQFPAAVGSQRRFCRPILPASQSAQTLDRQLQSHAGMLESFKADLSYQQQNPPEGKKARAKDLEEHRVRAEYLQHEVCRYEAYIQVLEAWKSVKKMTDGAMCTADLNEFDQAVCVPGEEEVEEEEGGLKKSYSSPSLDVDMTPSTVIKVRRNISERRTYRRVIIPLRNKVT
ncbi:uncharacterized protein KZ484_000166 isoform 2-T3 [Pholidichthys leucotaenia]